jgi:nitrogen fixation NifU-like protein
MSDVARLSAMYQDALLAEYRAPHNRRVMQTATSSGERKNPVCGDAFRVMVAMNEGALTDVSFVGQGCSIAVASASLLTQVAAGHTGTRVHEVIAALEAMLAGGASESLPPLLAPLRGVAPFPGRHGCAMLPWLALRDALR